MGDAFARYVGPLPTCAALPNRPNPHWSRHNIWLIRNRHDHERFWDGEGKAWDLLSLSTQGFTDQE